jgi:hypothetical protein
MFMKNHGEAIFCKFHIMMYAFPFLFAFIFVNQELPSLSIDDSQCGTRPPVIRFSPPKMLDCTKEQPPGRQQKAQAMNWVPPVSPTPSALPKQRMGVTPPSSTGIMQTDGVRKSPMGELGVRTIDFVREYF